MNKYLIVVFLLTLSRANAASYASDFPGTGFYDESLFPAGNRSTKSGDLTPPLKRRYSVGYLSLAALPALVAAANQSAHVQKSKDTPETAKK